MYDGERKADDLVSAATFRSQIYPRSKPKQLKYGMTSTERGFWSLTGARKNGGTLRGFSVVMRRFGTL